MEGANRDACAWPGLVGPIFGLLLCPEGPQTQMRPAGALLAHSQLPPLALWPGLMAAGKKEGEASRACRPA